MNHRDAWSTAQVPYFVPGPAGHVPSDPAKKAEDAATLAAQVAAFRKAGGKVEVVTTPSRRTQTNTSSRTRRTAKA
jgi:hypothetical protein